MIFLVIGIRCIFYLYIRSYYFKTNTTQYYVYDYQDNRVRSVAESDHQVQSQIDYLPSLDLSTNQAKQQTSTLLAIGIKVRGTLFGFSTTIVI
jgi:hypothetical protein